MGEPRAFQSPLGQRPGGFAYQDSLPAWRPRGPGPASCVPHRSNTSERYRNLNLLSITYASRPRLRPDSPAVDQHGCGTLGHSVGGFAPPRATHADIRTRGPLQVRFRSPSPLDGTLPYHCLVGPKTPGGIRGFGAGLEPRWIVGAATPSTSELLRTLSRMAASKPTSWLFTRLRLPAHLVWTSGP